MAEGKRYFKADEGHNAGSRYNELLHMNFWRESYRIDRVAFDEVVRGNCYRLDRFSPDELLIDVGAHIGAFCYAALERGARRVVAIEADNRNYTKLTQNMAIHPQGQEVVTLHNAVWRSDVTPNYLPMARFNEYDREANTGAGTIVTNVPAQGLARQPYYVMTVSLDAIITMFAPLAYNQRVAFLKMDCEGSEFPILYTSQMLYLVDRLAIELHTDYSFRPEAIIAGFSNTLDSMVTFLRKAGYWVTVEASIPHRPYIFAKRTLIDSHTKPKKQVEGYFDFPRFYEKLAREAPHSAQIAEVGVWKGASACFLGRTLKFLRKHATVWCVDTWRGSEEHGPSDQEELASEYGRIWHTFNSNVRNEGLRDILVPVILPSQEAAKLFTDGSLWAVYIDANHSYENVLADIETWLPKVSRGGYLCGHDYSAQWGVKKAVDEVFGRNVQFSDVSTWFVRVLCSRHFG